MMIITTFHWLLKTLIDFILKLSAVWRLIDATDKIIFKTSKQKYAGHIISTDGRNIMLILVFISVYQKLLNRSVMIKKYRYCIFAKYLLAFLRALEVFSRNVRFDFSWYSIVLDWAGLGWAGLDWTVPREGGGDRECPAWSWLWPVLGQTLQILILPPAPPPRDTRLETSTALQHQHRREPAHYSNTLSSSAHPLHF